MRSWWLLPLCCALSSACDSSDEVVYPPEGSGTAAASAKPVDRLEPGELAPGNTVVFGFRLPRDLTLERRFPDAAHAVGRVRPEHVANYVRQQVVVQHVEVGAGRTVFPRVRIKGGDAKKMYRIEVIADGAETKLVIRDVTPPPTVQGLTEAERWRQAGRTPDGKLINPKQHQ